jgi:alpha-1,3-glucosyltransferase
MYPLLQKDGLVIPYFTLMVLFYFFAQKTMIEDPREVQNRKQQWNRIFWENLWEKFVWGGMAIIHIILQFMPAPQRYPDLWVLLLCVFSFGNFCIIFLCYLYEQIFKCANNETENVLKKMS